MTRLPAALLYEAHLLVTVRGVPPSHGLKIDVLASV